jgi:hypothetical protein
MPQTFMLRHHGADTKLVTGRMFVIGREPSGDLCIRDDMGVSRRHAALKVEPEGVWIEDLGSQNGVFVNGSRIERIEKAHPLKVGDWFRVGQREFSLRVLWTEAKAEADSRTQSIRVARAARPVDSFADETTPIVPPPDAPTGTPSTLDLKIREVDALVSLKQSCRAAIGDSGLSLLDRINGAFHLTQAIMDLGAEADAAVLLGEMLDLLRRQNLGGVLPPLCTARIHALVSRLMGHIGTDPAWQARLEALRRAGQVDDPT